MTIAHGSGRRRSRRPSSERVLARRAHRGSDPAFAVLDGLHRVAAELVPQRGRDLRREVDLLPRGEAREERGADHRHRHVLVDRLVDRPAALAGVLDVAVRCRRARRRAARTRRAAARAATSGRPSRSARCRRSRSGRGRTPSGASARSPRRTPASARTRSRCGPSSRSGRRRTRRRARSRPRARAPRRSGCSRLHRRLVAAGHQAEADLEAPDAAGDADVDEARSSASAPPCSGAASRGSSSCRRRRSSRRARGRRAASGTCPR